MAITTRDTGLQATALQASLRWFPLLGRPRPACPALTDRVTEIAQIAETAAQHGDVSQAAHALNKAALIASDCGLPDLARQWCWRHINLYRQFDTLTVLQASYLLEPVLNLARLQIRAHDGQPALQLLKAIYQAVTRNTNLIIDGHTLPLANLTGPRDELRKLHQWAWLQYLSEGIRIHALHGSWDQAVAHATALNGVGQHLMDGRQAAIITHCLHGEHATARTLLHDTTITEPWEKQVAACLAVMCAELQRIDTQLTALIEQFLAYQPIPGYGVFRARLGLTATTLASDYDNPRSQHLIRQVATEAIVADDGYAAREVLGCPLTTQLSQALQNELGRMKVVAGLGARSLAAPISRTLVNSVEIAERTLTTAIDADRPGCRAPGPAIGPTLQTPDRALGGLA